MNRNTKTVVYSVFVLLAIAVGWGMFNYIRSLPLTARLDIRVSPQDARIVVNNKRSRGGVIKVRPGRYTVTVSRPGFASSSQTVTVQKAKTAFVGLALTSNASDTTDWYLNHPADQQAVENISSHNSDQIAQQIADQNPIISNLPYTDQMSGFSIDYGQSKQHPQDSTAIALYITLDNSQASKLAALQWIRFVGYDPAKYEIIYSTSRPPTTSANPKTEE